MVVRWGKEGREMTAMRSVRAAGLALAMLTASAAAVLAQTKPWPAATPQQAPAQAPWPAAAPQQAPAQAPWPAAAQPAQPMAMPAPGGPMMGGGRVGGGATAAEHNWIKFSEDNRAKCGIPKEAVNQIKGVHVHTADARKKICATGPQAGAPAAPSLSDALGTSRLPAAAAEKPAAGGLHGPPG